MTEAIGVVKDGGALQGMELPAMPFSSGGGRAEIDILLRLQALALAQSLGVPRGMLYTTPQNWSMARAQLERFIKEMGAVAQRVYGLPAQEVAQEAVEETVPIGGSGGCRRGDSWCGIPNVVSARDRRERIEQAIEEAEQVIRDVCEKIDVPVEEIREEARRQRDEEGNGS